MRRVAMLLVMSLLLPSSTAWAGPLTDAANRAGRELASSPQATGPKNPYRMGSFVLMGAGAGLLLIGLLQDRGAEVGTNATGTSVTVTEKGGSKTAFILIGGAAIAGGAGLYVFGETKKKSIGPLIQFTRSGVTAGVNIGF